MPVIGQNGGDILIGKKLWGVWDGSGGGVKWFAEGVK